MNLKTSKLSEEREPVSRDHALCDSSVNHLEVTIREMESGLVTAGVRQRAGDCKAGAPEISL